MKPSQYANTRYEANENDLDKLTLQDVTLKNGKYANKKGQ
jgi:hypothetical protein